MLISEAKSVGIFKVRVKVGEFFSLPSEAITVTFREPTFSEVQEYMIGTEQEKLDKLKLLMPKCIVASDFESEPGKPATAEQVLDILLQSAMLYAHAAQTWQEALPLEKRRAGNSGN